MEYAKLGKLQSVLRNSRGVNYYTNTHGPSSLTSHELIMFCYQIAKGMDFLSSKGVRYIEPALIALKNGYYRYTAVVCFFYYYYYYYRDIIIVFIRARP